MKKYNYIPMIMIFSPLFLCIQIRSTQGQNANEEIQNLSENIKTTPSHSNPIILEGVNQIMNGALSIAQNPHNRPNIGLSIANMIHGIIKIIIEKIAHKKQLKIIGKKSFEEYNELCEEITEEITTIIMQQQEASK